ncbi:hypothetical protein swp_2931 [Shewanella piezotolerans WP3]|uniref:Uncharacterized protein n=1 Tax=Shewanella piezotolerans (strain WP3 / JCM 13877) TaxID=225849 RepID=B8CQY5_SHEPW|nr:hypothetical protein swp_2931 [Shewanella piezotolerans WP3]
MFCSDNASIYKAKLGDLQAGAQRSKARVVTAMF